MHFFVVFMFESLPPPNMITEVSEAAVCFCCVVVSPRGSVNVPIILILEFSTGDFFSYFLLYFKAVNNIFTTGLIDSLLVFS